MVKFGPRPFGWYFGLVITPIRHSGFGAYSVSSCDARKNKFVKKLKMWKKIPAKLENIVKSRPRTLSSLFFLDHISNQSTVNTEFEAKMSASFILNFGIWHLLTFERVQRKIDLTWWKNKLGLSLNKLQRKVVFFIHVICNNLHEEDRWHVTQNSRDIFNQTNPLL